MVYAKIFLDEDFEGLGWTDYNNEFLKLKEKGQLEDELPLIADERREKLYTR